MNFCVPEACYNILCNTDTVKGTDHKFFKNSQKIRLGHWILNL